MTPSNPLKPSQLNPDLKKLINKLQENKTIPRIKKFIKKLEKKDPISALNQLKLLELYKNTRKPNLAIYDHAFHFIGGAQKYGLTIAEALQKDFDITLIANKPVSLEEFNQWYALDLSHCTLKIIPLEFFDKIDPIYIDPIKITKKIPNPFLKVSKESANYDIFINNSMLEMVCPLSCYSVMTVHFPERRPSSYFYADYYNKVIYNSKYTRSWIQKRWDFEPHTHIYPPVDMEVYSPDKIKENLIISVARFDKAGNKKQLELARAFYKLNTAYPEITNDWRFYLIGGSSPNNPYLSELTTYIKEKGLDNCEIKINITNQELKEYYSKAKIFWHLCGLGQNDPARVEHFGMTIAEAMQNRIIPLVFDGGGQREIVQNDVNGYRTSSSFELIQHTIKLIQSPDKLSKLSDNAYKKSKEFSKERFVKQVKEVFLDITKGFFS